MDPAFLKDVVEVHMTPEDPYAIIAFGHSVVGDPSAAHIVLNQDDL